MSTKSRSPQEKRRVVIVSPTIPTSHSDNAGGGFLSELVSLVSSSDDVTIIAPATAVNTQAATTLVTSKVLLIDETPLSRCVAVRYLQERVDRYAPLRPPRGFLRSVFSDPQARQALQDAELVDIEWPGFAWAIRTFAGLAPSARIISTLHDVPSQGLRREFHLAGKARWRARLLANVLQARILERRVLKHSDTVVVFSEKDRGLLKSARNVTVVAPHIQGHESAPAAGPSSSPVALFVGPLRRQENWDAATWLCSEIWPRVVQEIPAARLRFVGASTAAQREELAAHRGVEAAGFVADLGQEYAEAAAAVVPLRLGAGVKFKVLEAIASGVPVIATTVGNEGIGDAAFTPCSFDDPGDFAAEVTKTLRDPQASREAVTEQARWASNRYGYASFARGIRAAYGLPSPAAPHPSPAPDVSVVIPVFNGEHLLPDQLAALARQPEAKRIEVVIADNGSTDRTADVAFSFREAFADLRVIDAGERRGVNHARNRGVAAAMGTNVLICDHDDVVRPGWISALVQALTHADIAGGHAVPFWSSTTENDSNPAAEYGEPLSSTLGYLPYALGGSLGLRRHAALAVGGFDEAFIGGHDEADLCWRMQEAGFSLVAAPGAVVDYRQRNRARDAYRQSRSSARTRILLWARFSSAGSAVGSVSFRGALRDAVVSAALLPRLFVRRHRSGAARELGWAFGTLVGHWRYRVRKGVPPQRLMTSEMLIAASPRLTDPHDDPDLIPPSPHLSVIIPVRNGATLISQQLAALSAQEDCPDFEIIVSDNGSTDNLPGTLATWTTRLPQLRLVSSGSKAGVAHARNIGVLAARAPSVAFCDADDVVDRRWVAGILQSLAADDAVTGECHHDRLNPPERYGHNRVSTPAAVADGGINVFGGNFGVRRDAYLSIGGMDESFRGGNEDDDFSSRLRRAGLTVGIAKNAVIHVRLRETERGTFTRHRRFGRESIRERLWDQKESGSPRPLSLKASALAIPGLFAELLRAQRHTALDRASRLENFAYGVGQLEGHLRYRFLGSVGPRELIRTDTPSPGDVPLLV